MKIDFKNLTRRETARALGVSENTIGRWLAKGAPRNENGRYNLPLVVKWRIGLAYGDRSTAERLDSATLRYKEAKAASIELSTAEHQGKLLPASLVMDANLKWYHGCRNRLESIPHMIAASIKLDLGHEKAADGFVIASDTIRDVLADMYEEHYEMLRSFGATEEDLAGIKKSVEESRKTSVRRLHKPCKMGRPKNLFKRKKNEKTE